MALRVAASLFVAGSLPGAEAWGPDGHTIVAHIAENLVSSTVREALQSDLNTTSLRDASRIPDGYCHTPEGRWSAPLHYINYPGESCDFVWERDCKEDICAPGALVNYSRQVFSRHLSAAQRLFALEFVVHMMGDLHQPLHTSSDDDAGANFVNGKPFMVHFDFNGTADARVLHALWDEDIVIQDIAEQSQLLGLGSSKYVPVWHDWQKMTRILTERIQGQWAANVSAWDSDIAPPADSLNALRHGLGMIGNESAALGCKYSYVNVDGSRIKPGDSLGRDYYQRSRPIVEQQLAKAGVRLARLLSDALAVTRAEEALESVVLV